MDEEVAYLTTSLMRSVIEEGTGRRAQSLRRPVAGKTGPTNDARDAWVVGYSTDLVVAVWVGFDHSEPLGYGESGSATALPGWIDFMREAHARRPKTQFPRPSNIVRVSIDPSTGLLARLGQEDAIAEEFLPDTEPSEVSPEALPDAGVEETPTLPGESPTEPRRPTLSEAGGTLEELPPF
jgi:penicillin-binding protein 1A